MLKNLFKIKEITLNEVIFEDSTDNIFVINRSKISDDLLEELNENSKDFMGVEASFLEKLKSHE